PEHSMPPYNCHLIRGPADGMVLIMVDTPLDIIWKESYVYRYSGRRVEDEHPNYDFQENNQH
ncbi:hypothetical protein, partial [Pseudomonas silesiensis]|uniref:hypothetical protein n=1 Tax=Pseudomonas silesiensis TaxID=1853130 RepID=UPI0034D6EF51